VSPRWLHDAQHQVCHDGASSRHEVLAIFFHLFIELEIITESILAIDIKIAASVSFHLR
jgi:hypothetical protein